MNARVTLLLTGVALSAFAVAALPRAGFAQTDPLVGTWQLDVSKSKYTPGPLPKSQTTTIQPDGQNHKITITTTDAAGKSTTTVLTRSYDGMPHAATGNPDFDAESAMRVNANTIIISYTKGGRLAETATMVLSPDGKTRTFTTTGVGANGQPFNNLSVYEKR